jgi:hypothetical protein
MAFTQRNMAAGPGKKYNPSTNPAPRDQAKYNATVDVKKGETLSKDPVMRKAQDAKAKSKAAEWSARHGGLPRTAANVEKYGE